MAQQQHHQGWSEAAHGDNGSAREWNRSECKRSSQVLRCLCHLVCLQNSPWEDRLIHHSLLLCSAKSWCWQLIDCCWQLLLLLPYDAGVQVQSRAAAVAVALQDQQIVLPEALLLLLTYLPLRLRLLAVLSALLLLQLRLYALHQAPPAAAAAAAVPVLRGRWCAVSCRAGPPARGPTCSTGTAPANTSINGGWVKDEYLQHISRPGQSCHSGKACLTAAGEVTGMPQGVCCCSVCSNPP